MKTLNQKLESWQNLIAILIAIASSLVALLIIIGKQDWLEGIALLGFALVIAPITSLPEWVKTSLAIFTLLIFFS